jgi:DNA-binding transcriptional MerR regulator
MAHSQYRHFLSRAEEGAKALILPARGHECMRCFTDQVKLTCALVQDLNEAIKEVKMLGEHEEESSQKITELEALCKKLREDTQRLEEEKATLEEMVKSRDALLMEITRETGLDRLGEDEDEEEEEEDANDGGDATAPPSIAPPPPAPLLSCLRRSMKKALWPKQEAPMS